uniref:NADH-ubiquinone oxidoreductase chain 3 n=1 Tax=Riccardoella reaumuri TaxID=2803873 RepID=A0A7R7UNN7_9ACAR|nr:NADH dehydrogenase subunit 3 [Riccardoella reaumuri]
MKFMMSMMIMLTTIIMLMMMFQMIMEKMNYKKEKMINFECGFNSIMKNKIPFSTNFFLITILFLMFDLEFIILFPPMIMQINMSMMNITMIFFMFLSLIMFMEWYYMMMEWSK